MQITVYVAGTDCPRCELLKATLTAWERPYASRPLDAAAITEMRLNDCFTLAAPVLQVGDAFIGPEELFPEGKLDEEKLRSIIA